MMPASTPAAETMRLLGSGASFRHELMGLLENVDLLQGLSWRETEQLGGYMQAYEAEPGCVVFREGEPGAYLCLLVRGKVKTSKHGSDGEAVVTIDGKGRSIGEMALIDGEPRSASCEVTEQATLLLLTRSAFERLCEQHPALGFKLVLRIARLMSRRLRITSGRLIDYLDH
jgi:CRP-like cAMP-binding protein